MPTHESSDRPILVIVGAGTMGVGIATAGLIGGYHVRLVDSDASTLEAASRRAVERATKMVEAAESDDRENLGELSRSQDLADALVDADTVIEAVPEHPELKRTIFASLAQHASPTTLLASNTSTLSIADLSEAAGGSSRVIGMHFFNPAHRMKLVEIINGPATSAASTRDAVAVCRRLDKEPIIVSDTPGFVTSRLGLILGNEAMRIVQEGVACPADVDTALRLGYNHPMGPLELADLVGLDARLNNLISVSSRMDRPEFEPPQLLIDMVESGRLGRKSGEGFYRYDDEGTRIATPGGRS